VSFWLIFLGVAVVGGPAAARAGQALLVLFLVLWILAATIDLGVTLVHTVAGDGPTAAQRQAAHERDDCFAHQAENPGADCSLVGQWGVP
jgi:disulfide bond formation protein DsbB